MSTTEAIGANSDQKKRGRKGNPESRANEIRSKLLVWKQTPEAQRVSLRALASEIGTSHQLLSFYLRRLDTWQMRELDRRRIEEYQNKAQEASADEKNRPLTQALSSIIGPTIYATLRDLRKEIKKHGQLSGSQIRIARLLASKGYLEAQEILNVHVQRENKRK